jgi:flagellar hook-length control protein FliK
MSTTSARTATNTSVASSQTAANSRSNTAIQAAEDASAEDDSASPDTEQSGPSAAADPVTATQTAATASVQPAPDAAVAATIDQSSFANFAQSLASAAPAAHTAAPSVAAAPTPAARFVAENHPTIVQSVKTELLPSGGTMKLRLDPPELGAMQVHVQVKDGVVTASFETTNDQATKMLSHSLGQLKQALEAQGITVGKLHVQQAPKDQTASNSSSDKDSDTDSDQSKENTSSSHQDEQRREALRRMWEKLALGGDPLDLVA